MTSHEVLEQLKDPAYLDLHMVAVASMLKVGRVPWYDGYWLREFEAAKHFLHKVRPDAVERFVAGMEPLRPPKDFGISVIDRLFDEAKCAKIIEVLRSIPQAERNAEESWSFGRDLVRDHPCFTEIQAELLPLVCELTGLELVSSYNFLSLYKQAGKCDPHMDEPSAMFTLDYCIEQSVDWPIHFSEVVEWPSVEDSQDWDPSDVTEDPNLSFQSYTLKPNQALLFTGSSQWHFREEIPQQGFCNLLFFHYFPAGCESLVQPLSWPKHFDIPELVALCDLFKDGRSGELAQ